MQEDERFESLLSRLADSELEDHELAELAGLAVAALDRQQAIKDQLEADEMIALSMDEFRSPSRLLAAIRSRLQEP